MARVSWLTQQCPNVSETRSPPLSQNPPSSHSILLIPPPDRLQPLPQPLQLPSLRETPPIHPLFHPQPSHQNIIQHRTRHTTIIFPPKPLHQQHDHLQPQLRNLALQRTHAACWLFCLARSRSLREHAVRGNEEVVGGAADEPVANARLSGEGGIAEEDGVCPCWNICISSILCFTCLTGEVYRYDSPAGTKSRSSLGSEQNKEGQGAREGAVDGRRIEPVGFLVRTTKSHWLQEQQKQADMFTHSSNGRIATRRLLDPVSKPLWTACRNDLRHDRHFCLCCVLVWLCCYVGLHMFKCSESAGNVLCFVHGRSLGRLTELMVD
jgi:hypothetical protein